MKLPSIKIQLIIFLTLLAAYLSVSGKAPAFLPNLFIAVSVAIITDSIISYLRIKKLTLTDSSIISGLIIGYVLSSAEPWWMPLLASISAIVSKHIIRINKKHLFNPAAFGLFLVIILFGASMQWKGADVWYILVPFGIYFVSKIRKMEIVVGYIIAFLGLFGVQALIQNTPLSDIIYQNYFFIFVMLIEPKTTPISKKGKVVFGIAVAALIFILTQAQVKLDAELFSLLTLNLFSPLLNELPQPILKKGV